MSARGARARTAKEKKNIARRAARKRKYRTLCSPKRRGGLRRALMLWKSSTREAAWLDGEPRDAPPLPRVDGAKDDDAWASEAKCDSAAATPGDDGVAALLKPLKALARDGRRTQCEARQRDEAVYLLRATVVAALGASMSTARRRTKLSCLPGTCPSLDSAAGAEVRTAPELGATAADCVKAEGAAADVASCVGDEVKAACCDATTVLDSSDGATEAPPPPPRAPLEPEEYSAAPPAPPKPSVLKDRRDGKGGEAGLEELGCAVGHVHGARGAITAKVAGAGAALAATASYLRGFTCLVAAVIVVALTSRFWAPALRVAEFVLASTLCCLRSPRFGSVLLIGVPLVSAARTPMQQTGDGGGNGLSVTVAVGAAASALAACYLCGFTCVITFLVVVATIGWALPLPRATALATMLCRWRAGCALAFTSLPLVLGTRTCDGFVGKCVGARTREIPEAEPSQTHTVGVDALEAAVSAQRQNVQKEQDKLYELMFALQLERARARDASGDEDALVAAPPPAPTDGSLRRRRPERDKPAWTAAWQNYSDAAQQILGQARAPKPGQEKALRALADGRDLVAVLPTGGGKTDVFQFPGRLRRDRGVTVVVTPLRAIIDQQVRRLQADDVCAIDTSSSGEASGAEAEGAAPEARDANAADDDRIVLTTIDEDAFQGRHDEVLREATTQHVFYYATPERLVARDDETNPHVRDAAARELLFIVELHRRGLLDLIAVDEAHVVTEWSSWRSSLRGLGSFWERVIRSAPEKPRPSIVALTGTANKGSVEAIAESLKMRPDYEQIRVSVDRPEIVIAALDVSYLGGTYPKVLGDAVAAARRAVVGRVGAGRAMAFFATRNDAEMGAVLFGGGAANAYCYHAGVGNRDEVMNMWKASDSGVLCCTSAAGMGVDAVVRIAFHFVLRTNVVEYWQEIGRIGRDGAPALAVLAYHPLLAAVNAGKLSTLEGLDGESFWALFDVFTGRSCRRRALLALLGDDDVTPPDDETDAPPDEMASDDDAHGSNGGGSGVGANDDGPGAVAMDDEGMDEAAADADAAPAPCCDVCSKRFSLDVCGRGHSDLTRQARRLVAYVADRGVDGAPLQNALESTQAWCADLTCSQAMAVVTEAWRRGLLSLARIERSSAGKTFPQTQLVLGRRSYFYLSYMGSEPLVVDHADEADLRDHDLSDADKAITTSRNDCVFHVLLDLALREMVQGNPEFSELLGDVGPLREKVGIPAGQPMPCDGRAFNKLADELEASIVLVHEQFGTRRYNTLSRTTREIRITVEGTTTLHATRAELLDDAMALDNNSLNFAGRNVGADEDEVEDETIEDKYFVRAHCVSDCVGFVEVTDYVERRGMANAKYSDGTAVSGETSIFVGCGIRPTSNARAAQTALEKALVRAAGLGEDPMVLDKFIATKLVQLKRVPGLPAQSSDAKPVVEQTVYEAVRAHVEARGSAFDEALDDFCRGVRNKARATARVMCDDGAVRQALGVVPVASRIQAALVGERVHVTTDGFAGRKDAAPIDAVLLTKTEEVAEYFCDGRISGDLENGTKYAKLYDAFNTVLGKDIDGKQYSMHGMSSSGNAPKVLWSGENVLALQLATSGSKSLHASKAGKAARGNMLRESARAALEGLGGDAEALAGGLLRLLELSNKEITKLQSDVANSKRQTVGRSKLENLTASSLRGELDNFIQKASDRARNVLNWLETEGPFPAKDFTASGLEEDLKNCGADGKESQIYKLVETLVAPEDMRWARGKKRAPELERRMKKAVFALLHIAGIRNKQALTAKLMGLVLAAFTVERKYGELVSAIGAGAHPSTVKKYLDERTEKLRTARNEYFIKERTSDVGTIFVVYIDNAALQKRIQFERVGRDKEKDKRWTVAGVIRPVAQFTDKDDRSPVFLCTAPKGSKYYGQSIGRLESGQSFATCDLELGNEVLDKQDDPSPITKGSVYREAATGLEFVEYFVESDVLELMPTLLDVNEHIRMSRTTDLSEASYLKKVRDQAILRELTAVTRSGNALARGVQHSVNKWKPPQYNSGYKAIAEAHAGVVEEGRVRRSASCDSSGGHGPGRDDHGRLGQGRGPGPPDRRRR